MLLPGDTQDKEMAMGKSAVLEYEYSLRKLPPVPSLSSSPALSPCWQTGILLSNLHTFLRWCDSHSYYKHRATLAPNPPTSNGSYTVMLHKQGKASILVLSTLFKIALPSKFQNLFSPSYNPHESSPALAKSTFPCPEHFPVPYYFTWVLQHKWSHYWPSWLPAP